MSTTWIRTERTRTHVAQPTSLVPHLHIRPLRTLPIPRSYPRLNLARELFVRDLGFFVQDRLELEYNVMNE